MSDAKKMKLERAAASGDRDAAEALQREDRRIYGMRSIFTSLVGAWVYVENGRIREVNSYYDSVTNRAALES